jgi:prepilin-type N-terminal cleavage/methylation domain-containing protein
MMQATTAHPLANHRPSRRAGVSLVEMMVATMVLAILGATIFTSLARLNRNAVDNRNYANGLIILRNAIDQALTRGWNESTPASGILLPTITTPDGSFDATSAGWNQWNPYSEADDTSAMATVPIFSDQMDPTKNVNGALYRKVQYVTGSTTMLWVAMQLNYNYDGKPYTQTLSTVRSMD